MMMAARQMAINDSPDKLELNGPCDEVKQPSTNKFKTFQSDVNVETIEIFDDNLQWRKSPHENKVPKTFWTTFLWAILSQYLQNKKLISA